MVKSYVDILRKTAAYRESRVLTSAIELDIFTQLGDKSLSADKLAHKTNTLRDGLEILLNALSGMGLLKKNNNLFSNTDLSLKYLNASSSESITNYLWLAAQNWNQWCDLTKVIQGKADKNKALGTENPELKKRFSLAVNERSLQVIPKLLQHIHVGSAKSLLDLGGGDGSYSFAILEKNPQLRVTIFDRPYMITAAMLRAFDKGVITKIKLVAGDFFKDDFGGPHDIVFLSNIIHIFGAAENKRLLEKITKALNAGGKLLIVDRFLEDDKTNPPEAAFFTVELFLRTDSGRCYSWSDVIHWLKAVGYSGFRCTRIDESAGMLDARMAS
ncbi:MAG: methyltransferase [Deltaproteobacteria bacterium]|nr:MAG: methyltransferase [Deltaproteobacteria bacterium]